MNETSNGKYSHNRKGKLLCTGFNNGTCKNTVRVIWCGARQDHMHLCDRCLGQHMISECNHKEITVPSQSKGQGKKG